MAYRLKPTGSIGKSLSHIVGRESEKALDAVNRHAREPTAVYEARKAIKKIRAILHLLRSELGHTYRTSNTQLRSIAHQLSSPRDAAAAVEVIGAVHRHYPAIVTAALLRAVRQGLAPEERAAAARMHPVVMRRQLAKVTRTLARRVRQVATHATVRAGIEDGYSRARRALRDVKAAREDVRFHAWRRRVKDHWYHVRLMEAVHPALRPRIARLRRLEVWLGDDHNLVLLRATLLAEPARFGNERATALILGCIDKYQATLRKRALFLGDRLFRATPGAFTRSMKSDAGR